MVIIKAKAKVAFLWLLSSGFKLLYGSTATGYWYIANAIEISGKNLLVISFFIGFLSTTKAISQIKKY